MHVPKIMQNKPSI